MSEPQTEAGRALTHAGEELSDTLWRRFRTHPDWRDFEPSIADRIQRIEAQARQQALDAAIAAVEDMGADTYSQPSDGLLSIHYVLAALSELRDGGG